MTTRMPWQPDAYLDLARRACFVCELLAGNPDYPHHIAHRDDHAVVFAPERGHLDIPEDEIAELARRLGERMAA
ncbi:hypothetical protein [Amycolatopsis sp. lyj-90]|uniref:hypothetical protein n=1 Tax=Amycolatopsis sp. lyj-90 TaxID=2789285 RepID=UPI00397AB8DA